MLGEIDELERKSSQRGARLQVVKEWMENQQTLFGSDWMDFLEDYPEANEWFNEEGVAR